MHPPYSALMASDAIEQPLVAATRRTVEKHGYGHITIERIAAEAGLNRVTLHRRGVTKQALLDALTAEAIDDYRRSLWPALTSTAPARERLEQALTALCEVAERNLALLLGLGTSTDAVFHEEGDEALTRTAFTEPIEKLLVDGASDGTLRAVDPAETATLLFNLVGWTYIHLRTGHKWNPERARESTLDVALNGVAVQ